MKQHQQLPRAQTRWLRWRGIPLLVLAATLALTLAYWQHARLEARQSQQQAFDAELRNARLLVEERIAAHRRLLQGVQGFLGAAATNGSPKTAEAALGAYVDALRLTSELPGARAVAAARRQGANGAQLTHMEPAELAGEAGGVDLMAVNELRQALEHARDSGGLGLSTRVDLVRQLRLAQQPTLAASTPEGFLLALPVYGAELPETVRHRRDALQGWALLLVSAADFMASLRSGLPAGLALNLYDEDEPAAGKAQAGTSAVFSGREQLLVGGRPWTLVLSADERFAAAAGDTSSALMVLAIGGTMSLLLALLAWLLGTARDRAQSRAEHMTRSLRESEQRWAFALEGAGDGVWDWNIAAGTLSSSARGKTIMGLRPGRPEPKPAEVQHLVHPEDLPRVRAELQRCLDGLAPNLMSEFRVAAGPDGAAGADGGWNWVLCRGTVVERDAAQQPLRMIGTLSDINARRISEERVRFMALHDPLTELANRAHFGERVHFALANARRYNESLGLILLDLNRFKPVNDEHGHAVGDQLLQTVARRIKSCVRETDTVGRIGGDEFVVLLTGPVTRETAQVVADKIFNQVALPMEFNGVRLEITCSLGLALYPQDGVDEMALTKAADDAMYRNKRAGRAWTSGAPRALDDYAGGGK